MKLFATTMMVIITGFQSAYFSLRDLVRRGIIAPLVSKEKRMGRVSSRR